MNEKTFHETVSGRGRGIQHRVLRVLFWLAQWPYRLAVWGRNRRFDRNPDAVCRVEVPVISVGNLTVGGTGKTPMVKWLARRLRSQGVRVAILSRGYGAEQGSVNDEALELEQALPDVPHLQDPDRVKIARIAIQELDSQVLLLDDGFQHRRLARDLELVLLDATEPFGYRALLPRGLLREPTGALRRASVVCLTRADMVDAEARRAVQAEVQRRAPSALWCEASHTAQRLVNSAGVSEGLEHLAGKQVLAFCGIGNPAAFRHTVEALGCRLAAWREFPDHHAYSRADIESLAAQAAGAELAICTHKDLAKIHNESLGETPLWALEIEMSLLAGEAELDRQVSRIAQMTRGE
ncbi:MAG: tetraacyldisaccharide 4'-kinase [Planctomycetales bacterium]|nr:tetraacyldisaccharide 4'-kinase [Planctomycetales bacterium]